MSQSNPNPKNLPTKIERVLEYLLLGKSLNRFEAERIVNDHCLHSTMSALKNKYGILLIAKPEIVPGWHQQPTRVTRYWLSDTTQAQAIALRQTMRRRRSVPEAA